MHVIPTIDLRAVLLAGLSLWACRQYFGNKPTVATPINQEHPERQEHQGLLVSRQEPQGHPEHPELH